MEAPSLTFDEVEKVFSFELSDLGRLIRIVKWKGGEGSVGR